MAVNRRQESVPVPRGERKAMLTYHQVVKAIAHLGNQCESEVISIRRIQRRLMNEGREVRLEQVKRALQRAVRAGMIAEVVENRYKTVRSRARVDKAGISGIGRATEIRVKSATKPKPKPKPKQASAVRGPPAGVSGSRRLMPSRAIARSARRALPSTSTPTSTPKRKSGLQVKAARKDSRLVAAARTKLAPIRGQIAASVKRARRSRALGVAAEKARGKRAIRAVSTRTRRLADLPAKRRATQLARRVDKARYKHARRARSQRPAEIEQGHSDDSVQAEDLKQAMEEASYGRGAGDEQATQDSDHVMGAAGTSDNDLIHEQESEAADGVMDSVPSSNGCEVVSIFPGWAK